MKSKEIYAIQSNSDLTEGRGHPVYVCCTDNSLAAERLKRGKGVMGSDAQVVKDVAYEVDGRWYYPYPFEPATPDEIEGEKLVRQAQEVIAKMLDSGFKPSDIKNLIKNGRWYL